MKNVFLLFAMLFTLNIGGNLNFDYSFIVFGQNCEEYVEETGNVYTIEDKIPEIIKVLKFVESQNNPKALGDNGKAKGILQIHEIYVKEVNNRYGTSFTHQQMFDPSIAEEVTTLYMKFFIKYYNKKFKKMPTEQDLVRIHNGGFVKGYKINATKIYYEKYLKIKVLLT